jgi:uncharacterized protein (DUF362 family)
MVAAAQSEVFLRGVAGRSVREIVAECMKLCEWESLVPRNASVVIKPNLCTAVPGKTHCSNTDPEITEAVCEILLQRTSNIVLAESDGLRQKADESFQASGYEAITKRLGIKFVNFTDSPWTKVECKPAGLIGMPKILLDAEVFITLPVLKTHALTYFTGALKNQWGCLPQYDRILVHRYLDEMLVSLHRMLRPKFAVMDGIVAMEGRGPTNGKPRRLDVILASQDSVALDATAMRLVGLEPDRSRHIMMAEKEGLGHAQANAIRVDGDWAKHATRFEPAILDKAIWAMDYMSRYRWFVKYALEKDYVFYPVRALVQVLRKVGLVEGGG